MDLGDRDHFSNDPNQISRSEGRRPLSISLQKLLLDEILP